MKNFNERNDIIVLLKDIKNRHYRVEVSGLSTEPTAKDFTNLSDAIGFYNDQPHGNGISVRLCVLRPDSKGSLTPSREYLLK